MVDWGIVEFAQGIEKGSGFECLENENTDVSAVLWRMGES